MGSTGKKDKNLVGDDDGNPAESDAASALAPEEESALAPEGEAEGETTYEWNPVNDVLEGRIVDFNTDFHNFKRIELRPGYMPAITREDFERRMKTSSIPGSSQKNYLAIYDDFMRSMGDEIVPGGGEVIGDNGDAGDISMDLASLTDDDLTDAIAVQEMSVAYDLQPEFMRGQAGIIDQHNPGIGSRVSIDPATAYAKRGVLKRRKPHLMVVSSTIVNTDTVETADTNNNASLTTNNLTTNRTVDVNASGGVTEIETMEVADTGWGATAWNWMAQTFQVKESLENNTETLENNTETLENEPVALTNSSKNETVPVAQEIRQSAPNRKPEAKVKTTSDDLSMATKKAIRTGLMAIWQIGNSDVPMTPSMSKGGPSNSRHDPYLFEAPGGREAYEKLINSFDYMDFEDAHTIGAPDAREQEMQQRVKSSLHHMDLLRKDEIARDSKNMWFTIVVGAVSGVVIAHMYR